MPVVGYGEFGGNIPSFDLDIDDINLSDVSSYVGYLQSFFDIMKNVFGIFPSFIWVILCLGITAVVVIGIIKVLK